MSWFIDFFKRILLGEDGKQEKESTNRRQYESQRLSSAAPYSWDTLNQSPPRSQISSARTMTSCQVLNRGYENSGNWPPSPKRESTQSNSVPSRNTVVKSCTTATDSFNKVPVVSSQVAYPSSATAKANLSSNSQKSGEVPPKANSVDVLQSIKASRVISEVSKQSSSNHVASASSQRSQNSYDLPAHVHSCKPPSMGNISLSASDGNGHKSYANVCSPLSKPSQSSSKLPLFQGSPKPSLPVSDTEKRSPTPEKDPPPSALPKLSRSPKPPPLSKQPTLSPFLSSSTSQEKMTGYVWAEKSESATYVFPEDIKSLIEKDIVPGILKMPLSPSTYKDYFHALLYAEDCHLEKWEGFEMKNVTLELHDATIYTKKEKGKSRSNNAVLDQDEKVFIAFDIVKILAREPQFNRIHEKGCERRPFLLSRDFVSVKPTGRETKPLQGVIYRVVRSSLVLVEFGESFHSQHDPGCEYDVKFSFNRVCLKRAHNAITTASETLYRNFLFPEFALKQEVPSPDRFIHCKHRKEAFAVSQILRLQGAPPYLVEGPISVVGKRNLSRTGEVIVEAVVRICRESPSNRVLLCAALNNTCDVLMRGLKMQMDESDMFRANAAFREIDGVPTDILPSCLYEEEMDCFACPSLQELEKYKVISSTFMSSFRLRDEGMVPGHFSHVFLVDASSVTEPEAMVPLANFVNSNTIVVVTGAPGNRSGWIRSKIARENGLRISYFERLRESKPYQNLDPRTITQLEDRPEMLNASSSLSHLL